MKRSNVVGVAGHVLALLVGAVFVVSGGSKLVAAESQVQDFARWGFPGWFLYGIGLLEVLGAILLVIPPTRIAGVAMLGIVMVGAVATHTVNGEYGALGPPIVLGVLLTIAGIQALLSPPGRVRGGR